MKETQKVTSIDLSIHLKDLCVEQESLFYWEFYNEKSYTLNHRSEIKHLQEEKNVEFISAFTSDELVEMLPAFVCTGKKYEPFENFYLEIHKRIALNIQYTIKYVCDTHGIDRYGNLSSPEFCGRPVCDENLPDALAKMLILLINEKLYVKRPPIALNLRKM